jgi:hypothetical protein
MEPVAYEVREEDVDEVLGAYGARADVRDRAVQHVMQHVRDIEDVVRTAPETTADAAHIQRNIVEPISTRAGDQSDARRELALGVIEDLLITDGFIDATSADARVFPVVSRE